MGFVYKITNLLDSKIYIGKTMTTIEHRWKLHKEDSTKSKYNHRPLYQAMNHDGVNNFKVEALFESENNKELCSAEQHYIAKYNSNNSTYGYNNTLGGDGRTSISNEKEIVDYYLLESRRSTYRTSIFFGIDKKTVKKILTKYNISTVTQSEARIIASGVKVAQIDKNTEKVIETFDSILHAAQKVGCTPRNIGRILDMPNRTACGYKWKRIS